MAKSSAQARTVPASNFAPRFTAARNFHNGAVLESAATMERAGDFLGQVVRRLKRPEAAFAWLASAWPGIVGKAIAAHSRPVRCVADCLELSADGNVWQKQLESMQRELCGRINQAWGGSLVRKVKIVAAKRAGLGPTRIPYEVDNEHLPFIRRRA